ncbi:corticospinal neuron axon guidance through spinal cord [Branchiostoma belcheri]|nr:corticospinal neuron axon guidance through spinal cord [Branchiostoma belcheri]
MKTHSWTKLHTRTETPKDRTPRTQEDTANSTRPTIITPNTRYLQRPTTHRLPPQQKSERLTGTGPIPKENKNFITKNIPSGSYPCGRKCLTCTYVRKSKDFHSHRTSRRYNIRAHITCRTKNIIYMIQCKKCGMQYVGETGQTLANRLNGHRSSIKTDKDTPVSAHFNQPNHTVADMEVIGLEKLAYGRTEDITRQRRLQRESFWIHQLRTLHPEGLNLESLEITRV